MSHAASSDLGAIRSTASCTQAKRAPAGHACMASALLLRARTAELAANRHAAWLVQSSPREWRLPEARYEMAATRARLVRSPHNCSCIPVHPHCAPHSGVVGEPKQKYQWWVTPEFRQNSTEYLNLVSDILIHKNAQLWWSQLRSRRTTDWRCVHKCACDTKEGLGVPQAALA